jgi:hypothetical protein
VRRCLPALRTPSERRVLAVETDRLVALQLPPASGGDAAIVCLSRLGFDTMMKLTGVPDGTWRELMSGHSFISSGGAITISLPALSPVVLIPEACACVD